MLRPPDPYDDLAAAGWKDARFHRVIPDWKFNRNPPTGMSPTKQPGMAALRETAGSPLDLTT